MKKNMFVLIDWQKDFVDGSLACPGAEKMDEKIHEVLTKALASEDMIVVTQDTHKENYLETREGRHLPIPHTMVQTANGQFIPTEGWELFGKTGELIRNNMPHVWTVNKVTFGAPPKFLLTMQQYCEEHDIQVENIYFMGLDATICVLSNICCFQAAFPEAQIVAMKHLMDSGNKDLKAKAFDVMAGIQVEVRD